MVRLFALLELLANLAVIWVVVNIIHAVCTSKGDEIRSNFLCVSNWLKRGGKK